MAQVSGGAAYKGYQKLNNGISQGLQHWGDIKVQENAAKKLADERAGIRKAEADEKYKKSLEGDFSYEMSKNDTYNDVVTSYSQEARVLATDEGRKAIEARRENRMDEARIHEQNFKGIQSTFDSFKTLEPKISAQVDWYVKNKNNLLLSDPRHKMYDALIKNNYLLKPSRDGKIRMIIGVDKDNDGKISKEEREAGNKYLREGFKTKGFNFEEVKPADFANGGYQSYMKTPFLEKGGLLDQLTSSVGITTIDKNDPTGNYKITTTSVTPDKYNQLKKHAKIMMNNLKIQANIMSKLGFLDKNGYIKKKYSKDEINKGVDYLLESAINKFGFKQTQTTNTMTVSDRKKQKRKDRALSYSRLTETKRHNMEMEKKAKLVNGGRLNKKQYSLSYRKAVIEDKLKEGDYSDVIGGETDNGTIQNVEKAGNTLIITTDLETYQIPVNESAYNDLLNEVQGTSLNMDEIKSAKAINIEDINGKAKITADKMADEIFERKGSSTWQENDIKKVVEKYGLDYEGAFDWFGISGDEFIIEGKRFNSSNREDAKKEFKKIFYNKFGISENKKPKSTRTSIKQSEIADKAKEYGYSTEEYIKLLKEKGIKIE